MLYTILVNWNGAQDTVDCLSSLAATRHDGLTVLVCDNASTDPSVSRIADWADRMLEPEPELPPVPRAHRIRAWARADESAPLRVVLIENDDNLGFAGGNNVGIALALTDPACRHIFLLNNDTEIEPDALALLTARMDGDPTLALCGATLVYHGRPDTVQGLGGTYNPLTARAGALHGDGPFAALPSEAAIEPRIDYVIGAAIFARADVLRRIGGLSEDYFLYYEELDLSRQLLPGERMGWVSGAVVRHKVGGSIGTGGKAKRSSDLSIYYDHRSKTRYYWTYRRHYMPFLAADLLRTSLAYLRRGDGRAARTAWRGVIDFFRRDKDYRPVFPRRT